MMARWRRLLAPTCILAIIGGFEIAAASGWVQPEAQAAWVIGYLRSASVVVIVAIAAIENIVGLTAWFPGSVAILVAMAATGGRPSRAIAVFAAIVIGAFVGQVVDFWYGRLVARPPQRYSLGRTDITGAVLTYWHPQLGSIYSAQRGARGLQFSSFVVLLALVWFPWNVCWGLAMYHFGALPVSARSWEVVFAAYCVVWLGLEMRRFIRDKRSSKH